MKKNQKYTVSIIGTGRIGFSLGFDKKREQPASHTMAVLKNKRLKLIAGCDNNNSRLEHFKRFNPNVSVYNDSSYLFATTKSDILIISVNESSHLETALSAIKTRPRLIILEKPVALTVAQGLKIKEEAQKFNVPIMINHERRFSEDYKMAKSFLQNIGDLVSVNARLDSGLRVYSYDTEKNGEYSLIHDGTHLVDIVSFLFSDEPFSDLALTNLEKDKTDSSVIREISFHAKNQKCSDINFTLSGKSKYFNFELDIFGTLGRIRIGNGIFEFFTKKESKLYSGFYSLEKEKIKPPKKTKYFSNMIQNAVDFLDQKSDLKSPLKTGLETLKILEEIKNQIRAKM